MSTEAQLRRAYVMVHNAEKLTRHALDPATFEFMAADFDRLIRQLNELARAERFLGDTDPGD